MKRAKHLWQRLLVILAVVTALCMVLAIQSFALSVTGTLCEGTDATAWVGSGETVYFEFVPQSSGTYRIQSVNSSGDTYGHLLDSEEKEIATDVDSGNDYNFMITRELTAGTTYYVGVRFYGSDTGNITFRASLASENQWHQIGNKWYYGDGDVFVRDQVKKIGNYYYGFDSDGVMITNATVQLSNYDEGIYAFYHFDREGHAITNSWYQDGSSWRYFEDNGACAVGYRFISGKSYFFSFDNGVMLTNTSSDGRDGYIYICDKNGVARWVAYGEDGWKKVGSDWYYVKGGEPLYNVVARLGGKTYGFGEDGKMLTGGVHYMHNPYNQKWDYYRFSSSGELVTGWYQDEYWYYYLSDGTPANGIQTIGGKTYFFSYDGRMATNTTASEGGYYYKFGNDGAATFKLEITTDGWKSYGVDWYYVENGQILRSKVKKIGSFVYGFDYEGRMLVNSARNLYNATADRYAYYRFDRDGHAIIGWYQDEYWYYYLSDGTAATGIQAIGGKTYYFYHDGRMATNTTASDGRYYYKFGSDGAATFKLEIATDGWKQYGVDWYYVENGQILRDEVKKIGSFVYGFDYEGRMLVNTTEDLYNRSAGRWGYYRFDGAGHAIIGWYQVANAWFYYNSDGSAASGKTNVGGKIYYFDYDGQMQTDRCIIESGYAWYVDNNGNETGRVEAADNNWIQLNNHWLYIKNGDFAHGAQDIGGFTYYFENCYMVSNTTVDYSNYRHGFDANGRMIKGGWAKFNDYWYYFNSDGCGLDGLTKIGNILYYFENGKMLTSVVREDSGKLYLMDKNGAAKELTTKNGWVQDRYYLVNGSLASGWKQLGSRWYYFDKETHELHYGWIYDSGKAYYADSTGAMVTGWYQTVHGEWSYFGTDGAVVNGWKQFGTQWYYFRGDSMVTGIVEINGEYNLFNSSGVWKGTNANEGWFYDGKDYYYVNEWGNMATYSVEKIGNNLYGFDDAGRMVTSRFYHNYYFNNRGVALKNTWVQTDYDKWRYCANDGRLADGWCQIGSSWYYFENNDMVTGTREIDGKLYNFGTSGASNGVGRSIANGWQLIDGYYYYYQNGKSYCNNLFKIGGRYFAFDGTGRMLFSQRYYRDGYYYVLAKDGHLVKNEWVKDGNVWYYGDANGVGADGLKKIGGSEYFFSSGVMLTGNTLSSDCKTLYLIGSNGVVYNKISANGTGWYRASNGDYYYKDGGTFATGHKVIGGVDYFFTYDGIMVVNGVYYDYGFGHGNSIDIGYAGSNGAVSMTDGWHGNSYLRNGYCLRGPQMIGGKYYYFTHTEDSGAPVKVAVLTFLDGTYFYYDGNGGRRAVTPPTNGWCQYGGKWYYFVDGSKQFDITKIGNDWYFLSWDNGQMLTNILMDTYYFGSDGKAVKNCWKTIDGATYYFGADGRYYTGTQKIGGRTYTFNLDGRLV